MAAIDSDENMHGQLFPAVQCLMVGQCEYHTILEDKVLIMDFHKFTNVVLTIGSDTKKLSNKCEVKHFRNFNFLIGANGERGGEKETERNTAYPWKPFIAMKSILIINMFERNL